MVCRYCVVLKGMLGSGSGLLITYIYSCSLLLYLYNKCICTPCEVFFFLTTYKLFRNNSCSLYKNTFTNYCSNWQTSNENTKKKQCLNWDNRNILKQLIIFLYIAIKMLVKDFWNVIWNIWKKYLLCQVPGTF